MTLVFVDVETTALGHLARPWEIAVIRRESQPPTQPGAPRETLDCEYLWIVDYTPNSLPVGTDPDALRIGGWETRGRVGASRVYCERIYEAESVVASHGPEFSVARLVHQKLKGVTLVGVGVHFDAAVLSALFRRHGLPEQPWHYAIHDLKSMGYGAALAQGIDPGLPMSSGRLADLAGVQAAEPWERHTALGDARWAARWWDELHAAQQVRSCGEVHPQQDIYHPGGHPAS